MADLRAIRAERLALLMEEIGWSQEDLAEAVGCHQSAISLILNGVTQNSRFLPKIAEVLAVNYSFLSGTSEERIVMIDDNGDDISEFEMMRRKKTGEPLKIVSSPPSEYRAEPTALANEGAAARLDSVLIPQLEIGYSMGGGSIFDDYQQVAMVPFPRDWLRSIIKGRFDEIFVARGQGDSMTPTVLDGDLVIVDTAQRRIDRQDALWCLAYGELGMIKRCRPLPGGAVQINSDNPSVTPITAHDGEMHVVGRVIYIIRKM